MATDKSAGKARTCQWGFVTGAKDCHTLARWIMRYTGNPELCETHARQFGASTGAGFWHDLREASQ